MDDDGGMINFRPMVLSSMSVLLTAGCSATGEPSAAPSTIPTVPAGCAAGDVRWSEPAQAQRLTRVTRFKDRTYTGEEVLAEPFTSSIEGLSAPDSWLTPLAAGLQQKIQSSTKDKIEVRTGPARIPDGEQYGLFLVDPANPDMLRYEGVSTITADFTVDCGTALTGTFTAWTDATSGSLACAATEPATDPLDRLARAHCPTPPSTPDPAATAPTIRLPDGSIDVIGDGE
jgi:hypothetical protein